MPLLSLNFTIRVKFNLFDILVTFCDVRFIGRHKYAECCLYGFRVWRFSPKSGFGGIKGGIHLGTWQSNLVVAIACLDTLCRFEEDWTNIVVAMVAIVDTHRRIYTQLILYLSNAMNCIGWTDNDDDDGDDVY